MVYYIGIAQLTQFDIVFKKIFKIKYSMNKTFENQTSFYILVTIRLLLTSVLQIYS